MMPLSFLIALRDTIKGAIAYCSTKERAKTHCRHLGFTYQSSELHVKLSAVIVLEDLHVRRSKYNKKVWEYWVDVRTIGSYTATQSEEIRDSTSVEGKAENFILGLEPGEPSNPYGEANDDDDGEEEEESDSEGETSGGKGKAKGKGKPSRKVPKNDVQEEHALEACLFAVCSSAHGH